jgi:hypothetical protein
MAIEDRRIRPGWRTNPDAYRNTRIADPNTNADAYTA